jgi:hypothetical protein
MYRGWDVGMGRKIIALLVIFATCLALSYCLACNEQQATGPEQHYLSVKGGDRSSIFLIESELSFGIYDRDIRNPFADESYPKKGDPAVIIQGTVRSDYEEDLYISLSANLYAYEGQQVGRVAVPSSAKPWFAVLLVRGGEIEQFSVYIDYDGTDIAHYEMFLYGSPAKWAPP